MKISRDHLIDALFLAGAAALVYGARSVYQPAGWIVFGVMGMVGAYLLEKS